MKTMKSFICLFLMMSSLFVSAQESVLLRYNLKKGDKYEVEMNMKQDLAPIMSMDITVRMITESLGKEGGNVKTTSKFKRMAIDMSSGDQGVKFDSDQKEEDMDEEAKKMKAEIAPLLDIIVHQKFNKYGKIIDTRLEPDVKGASQFMDQAQLTSMVYPEEAVKVGSSWTYTQSISGSSVKGTYTVKKITKNRVFADFSGEIGAKDEGKMNGTVEIDTKSGMIMDMKLSMNMSQAGMSMKMNVNVASKKIN